MTFSLDLEAFDKKTFQRANMLVRDVVIAVDASLVEKSPVGNPDLWAESSLPPPKGYVGGRFRANWQLGVNINPDGELYTPIVGPFPDKNPIDVPDQAATNIFYLVNNLPYANRLEDGWSTKQAPFGMVSITVLEFKPIVRQLAEAT